ncbi:hypothetical protein ABIA68_001604 [Stenotrophomonas rhizophila]|uniref:STAS-like domain-containing protein n=1 Tax=Stenotrophomonas rhizophila TaxID=216778 RepID=UPI0033973427
MKNMMTTIDIGRDFSAVPAGRHQEDGEYNGERFRNELLAPALRSYESVEVILDNTEGFGSSFLEEAFGGLVRIDHFSSEFLNSHLVIAARKPSTQRYKSKILDYITKATSGAR